MFKVFLHPWAIFRRYPTHSFLFHTDNTVINITWLVIQPIKLCALWLILTICTLKITTLSTHVAIHISHFCMEYNITKLSDKTFSPSMDVYAEGIRSMCGDDTQFRSKTRIKFWSDRGREQNMALSRIIISMWDTVTILLTSGHWKRSWLICTNIQKNKERPKSLLFSV